MSNPIRWIPTALMGLAFIVVFWWAATVELLWYYQLLALVVALLFLEGVRLLWPLTNNRLSEWIDLRRRMWFARHSVTLRTSVQLQSDAMQAQEAIRRIEAALGTRLRPTAGVYRGHGRLGGSDVRFDATPVYEDDEQASSAPPKRLDVEVTIPNVPLRRIKAQLTDVGAHLDAPIAALGPQGLPFLGRTVSVQVPRWSPDVSYLVTPTPADPAAGPTPRIAIVDTELQATGPLTDGLLEAIRDLVVLRSRPPTDVPAVPGS